MVIAQHQPCQPAPSRAKWMVPLGLGIGGPLVALLITAVGLGYDLYMGGKMPHPLVMYGLSMLSLPFLAVSYVGYQNYKADKAKLNVAADRSALPPSALTIQQLTEANQRHSPQLVETFISGALAQLNRQADERFVTQERIAIRQLGQEERDDHRR